MSVYYNPERKKEIVAGLKEIQDFQLKAADSLETKAWNILSVSSATFGIVSAIQVSIITVKTPTIFWIGLITVLVLYLLQVRHVLRAIKPADWYLVPGAEPETRYETLMYKYIAKSSEKALDPDEYYTQLIADYVGHEDRDDHDKIILGGIQKMEANNNIKAKHVENAARLLGFIIAGQILLSFIVVGGR